MQLQCRTGGFFRLDSSNLYMKTSSLNIAVTTGSNHIITSTRFTARHLPPPSILGNSRHISSSPEFHFKSWNVVMASHLYNNSGSHGFQIYHTYDLS